MKKGKGISKRISSTLASLVKVIIKAVVTLNQEKWYR
jgi:hypothetical protein